MSRIASVAPVLPEHCYPQSEITAELAALIAAEPGRLAVMERMHSGTRIATRHTALPLEQYRELGSFGEANSIFIRVATDLAERAVTTALQAAGIAADEVDFILFTTVTGIAAPSIDALLVERLGLRPDVKRMPSFGLGCVAGASGIARVHDYLTGHPEDVGLLVSVELCSLTLQRGDDTLANFVASGLFGDGAAAVVMVGDARPEPGPTVAATRSALYPASQEVIGWNLGAGGFEIVLSAGVAELIQRHFPIGVHSLLADNGLQLDEVRHWIAHPGGPRVLEAFADSLRLPEQAFRPSWDSLERVGNLSSSSVLHVLADVLDAGPEPGDVGLLFALGPGVSAEFVLLRWAS